MTNKELYNKASEAINGLFIDMSVSQRVCIKNLQNLKDEIEDLLESFGDDGGE